MSERIEAMPHRALVTGGAKRLGAAIVERLCADGWAVAVHYRSSLNEAELLCNRVTAGGGRAVAVQADLADEEDSARLIDAAAAKLGGPLGLLVNNASTFERDEIETVTREDWDRHMEPNLRAPAILSQKFAAQLPLDRLGCIINLIDQRVWNLTPHFFSYTISKAGLWAMTQTLALALAPRIRVNAIGPGPAMKSTHQTDEQFARQAQSVPLQRATSPQEIAAAVRFILDAPALTGQMLALDGGQHLAWAHPAQTRTDAE